MEQVVRRRSFLRALLGRTDIRIFSSIKGFEEVRDALKRYKALSRLSREFFGRTTNTS